VLRRFEFQQRRRAKAAEKRGRWLHTELPPEQAALLRKVKWRSDIFKDPCC